MADTPPARKGVDLKNPGNKEYVIFAGGALGLGLIYVLVKGKGKPATPTQPTQPTATGATGTGNRATGGPFTGNALTDAVSSAPVTAITPATGATSTARGAPSVRLPVLHAAQGAGSVLGSEASAPSPIGASSGGTGSGGAGPGAVGVYQALVKAGLQPYQAAGILGNIQNESSFNPEAVGDQGTSFGLIQWHNATYANAASYVTGNVAKDFTNQINAIVQLFKSHGIAGSSAGAVAGNWASQIEGCVGCQPGGSQYNSRVFNATVVYQDVLAGRYTPKVTVKPAAGTKPASGKTIAGLFPIVAPRTRPVALRTKAPARPAPRVRVAPYAGSGIYRAIVAAFKPRPRPRFVVAPRQARGGMRF